MRLIRFATLASVGLMFVFGPPSGSLQNNQQAAFAAASISANLGMPDALANRADRSRDRRWDRAGRDRTRDRYRNRSRDRYHNRAHDRMRHGNRRRAARRTARRIAQLPTHCAWHAPYHYCGGIYYQPIQENGATVYIIVTP